MFLSKCTPEASTNAADSRRPAWEARPCPTEERIRPHAKFLTVNDLTISRIFINPFNCLRIKQIACPARSLSVPRRKTLQPIFTSLHNSLFFHSKTTHYNNRRIICGKLPQLWFVALIRAWVHAWYENGGDPDRSLFCQQQTRGRPLA